MQNFDFRLCQKPNSDRQFTIDMIPVEDLENIFESWYGDQPEKTLLNDPNYDLTKFSDYFSFADMNGGQKRGANV